MLSKPPRQALSQCLNLEKEALTCDIDCASIIGTTLGQPTFLEYFRLDTSSNAAQFEGAMNGLFQGKGLLGTFLGGFIADKYGRRAGLSVSTIITIVGAAIQAGSVHIVMYLVARFTTGFGIGGVVLLVPLWQSEVAPPHARGLLVGLHGQLTFLPSAVQRSMH